MAWREREPEEPRHWPGRQQSTTANGLVRVGRRIGGYARREPWCKPALTAAAAWSEVAAVRLGDSDGEGELSWRWARDEAASESLAEDDSDMAREEEDADSRVDELGGGGGRGGGGGERVEGGSELRSGMGLVGSPGPGGGVLFLVLADVKCLPKEEHWLHLAQVPEGATPTAAVGGQGILPKHACLLLSLVGTS